MIKLTDKQKKGLEILQVLGATSEETSVCTQYLISEKTELVKEKGFSTDKVNGLNATEASNVTKGLVAKKPIQYGEKMLTHYWLTESGIDFLNSKEENN